MRTGGMESGCSANTPNGHPHGARVQAVVRLPVDLQAGGSRWKRRREVRSAPLALPQIAIWRVGISRNQDVRARLFHDWINRTSRFRYPLSRP